MSLARVRAAYTARAAEYAALFGEIEAADEHDRERLLAWARDLTGPVIDVGCGPGQWTSYLAGEGVDVEGIDPVPAFVDEARRRYPGSSYRIGRAEHLEVEDAALGGVLAWYSLIHTDPDRIGHPLAEFARCLRPGGGLAIGFVEGPELTPFDHAVTTAYSWPLGQLSERIERAGFAVVDTETRSDPGVRRHGLIIARRQG